MEAAGIEPAQDSRHPTQLACGGDAFMVTAEEIGQVAVFADLAEAEREMAARMAGTVA